MIEDFYTNRLNMLLTKDDIPYLKTFQDKLYKATNRVITWASGHSIDSELTRHYIKNDDGRLFICCADNKIYVVPSSSDYITLSDFLGINDYEIEESDVLNLLK